MDDRHGKNTVSVEERHIVRYRLRLVAGIARDEEHISWRADRELVGDGTPGGAVAGVTPGLLAAFDIEGVVDFLQRAIIAPRTEVVVHRAAARRTARAARVN